MNIETAEKINALLKEKEELQNNLKETLRDGVHLCKPKFLGLRFTMIPLTHKANQIAVKYIENELNKQIEEIDNQIKQI